MAARLVALVLVLVTAGCARPYISPLAPPPYRADIPAEYGVTWNAIVRALARQNLPLRAIARDSGVIASDQIVSPIGLYADCGRLGDDRLEGEALVAFTLFAEPNGRTTRIQINSTMRWPLVALSGRGGPRAAGPAKKHCSSTVTRTSCRSKSPANSQS